MIRPENAARSRSTEVQPSLVGTVVRVSQDFPSRLICATADEPRDVSHHSNVTCADVASRRSIGGITRSTDRPVDHASDRQLTAPDDSASLVKPPLLCHSDSVLAPADATADAPGPTSASEGVHGGGPAAGSTHSVPANPIVAGVLCNVT